MHTMERTPAGRTEPTLAADIAATAEVLRSLYLPHECRHLVELLQPGSTAAAALAERLPDEPAADAVADELFLDLVQTRLAGAATPLAQFRRMRELRDRLQIQVRLLDALQDRLGGAAPHGEEGGRSRLPLRLQRAELAALLRGERDRYEPESAASLSFCCSRAIQEQLEEAFDDTAF